MRLAALALCAALATSPACAHPPPPDVRAAALFVLDAGLVVLLMVAGAAQNVRPH